MAKASWTWVVVVWEYIDDDIVGIDYGAAINK
jgi:hypothetical protein